MRCIIPQSGFAPIIYSDFEFAVPDDRMHLLLP